MNAFTHSTGPGSHRQRGVAALSVSLLLFFAMCLVAVYANRGLLFEQRASANQYRAAQAFEAAEAGIEWAVAQLNQPQRVDANCLPSTDSADASFRERFLAVDPDSGRLQPKSWINGGSAAALQPACVRSADEWSCSCPSAGHPAQAAVDDTDGMPHPAYSVRFSAEPQPGLVRITATGCSSAAGACHPGAGGQADASVQLQVVLGLVPGLATAPQAALTVKGSVDAGAAALGLHNPDAASGGITVRAGGSVIGPALRLATVAGGVSDSSAATHDAALASIGTDRLFAAHFGIDKPAWHSHAAVQRVDCRHDCAARLAAAIDSADGNRMIAVDGDAAIAGPMVLGSAERPVLLVVDGRVTLSGDVTLHGLLYAADLRWDDTTSAQAQVSGALISEADYRGNGAPDLRHDAALLRHLQQRTGSFARVAGSWRDF